MSDLRARIKELQEAIQKAAKIEEHWDHVQNKLSEARKQHQQLQQTMEKEFKDVQKLENQSIKGLFYQILGSKEEQLEQERQEYLQASLQFDQADETVKLLEFELSILSDKRQDKAQLERDFRNLLEQRAAELRASESAGGQKILILEQQIRAEQQKTQQIEEAQQAGNKALTLVREVLQHLQQASNWGRWDMAGQKGGVSYLKHSAIDRAHALVPQTQYALQYFSKELRDVYQGTTIQLTLSLQTFDRFSDIFFDNLISDWIIQQKLNHAVNSVASLSDKIMIIMQSLDKELASVENKVQELESNRDTILLQ